MSSAGTPRPLCSRVGSDSQPLSLRTARGRSSATEKHDRESDERNGIGHHWPVGPSIEVVFLEEKQGRCDEALGAWQRSPCRLRWSAGQVPQEPVVPLHAEVSPDSNPFEKIGDLIRCPKMPVYGPTVF